MQLTGGKSILKEKKKVLLVTTDRIEGETRDQES